jgi:hypothetical protein
MTPVSGICFFAQKSSVPVSAWDSAERWGDFSRN